MTILEEISRLFAERMRLRGERKFAEADKIRFEIESRGYVIKDTPKGSSVEPRIIDKIDKKRTPGKIAIFGSGETSPTGRITHEELVKNFETPVKIALLQTPAGFEQNPHLWYLRLRDYLVKGLANYHPQVALVRALRNEGEESTNDPVILEPMKQADYIHTGAGSPTYAVHHLKDSLAVKLIRESVLHGASLSLASASALAFSRYVVPVYEIYKAGYDLFWEEGLSFFAKWGFNPVFIPHWNNREGGAEIDTSRCYMGATRFDKLIKILPPETVIVGIDEQTSLILDLENCTASVRGAGSVSIMKKGEEKAYSQNESFPFEELI